MFLLSNYANGSLIVEFIRLIRVWLLCLTSMRLTLPLLTCFSLHSMFFLHLLLLILLAWLLYICVLIFHSTRQYFVSPISFINASFFSHWMLLWFVLACFLVCSFLVKRILWRDISYDDVVRLHEILAARDQLVQGTICSCFRIREHSAQKSDIQVLRKVNVRFGKVLLCDNTSWGV